MKLTVVAAALVWIVISTGSVARSADVAETRTLYDAGQYQQAAEIAGEQVQRGIWNEQWPRLLIECQLVNGQAGDAVEAFEAAMKRYPTSLTLRMLGMRAYQMAGQADQAEDAKHQIMRLLQSSPTRFASRDNLIAAGRYFALRGEDSRQILELFYDRVRDSDPTFLEAFIATAELALEKSDFQVAAQALDQAAKLSRTDPRIPSLASKAWASSDAARSAAELDEALRRNPRHVPSLIERAGSQIDAEAYSAARWTIAEILSVNVHQPEAWSLLAVLAHLDGQFEIERLMRAAALSDWKNNPHVDHLIGLKLSQKYRFEEGAEYQRRAIEIDSRYWPASFQLAQDLLRLGQEDVGWTLADRVAADDPYNVVAANLVILADRMRGFTRIESDGIEVRMEPTEAIIYGDEVMTLLREAKTVLCEKYDVQPDGPIIVEIFPEQKDFAIRTFGLPGGAGFLGVCFGRVVTANSPASQGANPANWKSVLWHEFCHVVTLGKTKNRMPRWLSEGISVYEERQRDPSWGESMTPVYRKMILGEDLTPVSRLSGAFLNPKSALHLQFAYYESSLVIEFLVDRYGLDAVIAILDDLADGITMVDALARQVGSPQKLDEQFAEFAIDRAQAFAPECDWSTDGLPEKPTVDELNDWLVDHPNSYAGLMGLAAYYSTRENHDEAIESLEKLVSLQAVTGGRGGPLELLARAYRATDQTDREKETLERIVSLSSDSLGSLARLIELETSRDDWQRVLRYGRKYLAIQPMTSSGHDAVAQAAERVDRPELAAKSLAALAQMQPVDPAAVDYRLARALADAGRTLDAKRAVLRALDEAPRYRDAHRLLIELSEITQAETSQAETSREYQP